MDQESQDGAKKISTPEIILVGSFFALIDLIDLIGLLFALPLSDFTSIIAFPASQIYAYFRGIRQDMLLISNGLELIPYIGSMPLRTIAFGITVYAENNPKIKEALGVAEKLTGKAGGGAQEVPGETAPRPERRPAPEEAGALKTPGEEKAPEIEAGRLGGAYQYKAQPGLEETLAEGSEKQPERQGLGGATEEAPSQEKKEGQEIEAERLGGAYAQTGEAQEKKALEEAGLTEEAGLSSGKTKDVDVDENTGTVNLRQPNDNIIDGRSRFGKKPPENEQLKKAA